MQGSRVLIQQNKIENTDIYAQTCLIEKQIKLQVFQYEIVKKFFYLLMTCQG